MMTPNELDEMIEKDRNKVKEDRKVLIADQDELIAAEEARFKGVQQDEGTLAREDASSMPSEQQDSEMPSNGDDGSFTSDDESPNSSNGETDDETLRAKLNEFYESHNPDKLQNIDEIVRQYGREGTKSIDELQNSLSNLYDGETLDLSSAAGARFQSVSNSVSMKVDAEAAKTLTEFYKRYNPEKLKDVKRILRGFHGDMNALSSKLRAKYGVSLEDFSEEEKDDAVMLEEAEDFSNMDKESARKQLLKLYAQYDDDKLQFVDSIMDMYEGREGELVRDVREKFGVSSGSGGL
eukprot:g1264.t1